FISRLLPLPPISTLFPYTTLFRSCYKGNGNRSILKNDNLLTNVAGIMAFGVAFIPTDPISDSCLKCTLINFSLTWLHYAFAAVLDRKSTRLNSSHVKISYAVFCLK